MTQEEAVAHFKAVYGDPAPATASDRIIDRLGKLPSGSRLLASIRPGLYASGFLSLASVREDVADIGIWQDYLPYGSFWYAGTALGVLYIASPDDLMWLVHTRAGSVMKTDFALDEAFLKAATPSTADDLLMRPKFESWPGDKADLAGGQMLAPVPITADDEWDMAFYRTLTSQEYLIASAVSFRPVGPAAVSVLD